jgi:hypothetical protein
MASVAFAAPILPGKLEAWKQFNDEINGARRKDFETQQHRIGISRQRVWLQHTPEGDMAIIVQEGEDPQRAMEALGKSENEFDVWFKAQLKDIHGLDLSQPLPGPLPELQIDYMQPATRRGPNYDLPDFNA